MSKRVIGWLYFPNILLQIILLIVFLVCWQFYQSAMIGTEPQYSGGPNCTATTLSGQAISCLDADYQRIDLLHNIMVICIVLMALGSIAGLIAWSGALVNLARGQHWGWFTRMFFFSGLTLFIYLVGGPAVPKAGQFPIQPQNAYNLQGNPPLEAPLPLPPVVPPQTPDPSPQQPSALEVLQVRFARGEIEATAFQQMREMLKG